MLEPSSMSFIFLPFDFLIISLEIPYNYKEGWFEAKIDRHPPSLLSKFKTMQIVKNKK